MITQPRLKEVLSYCPETGHLVATVRRGKIGPGTVLSAVGADGYIRIGIDRKSYQAHRLAFLYMTGEWPEHDVDHINGIRTDNRWTNLRAATRTENMENLRSAHYDSTSGLLGAFAAGRRWCSKIRAAGVTRYLGTFDTAEEAHAAYLKAKRELHQGCTI